MGIIKRGSEIDRMRNVCKVTAFILNNLIVHTQVGDTGIEINNRAKRLFEEAGIEPVFLGLYGFPAVLCISVNENLIHGAPNGRPFASGDVIKYDIGARLDGFCSDMARTFVVGTEKDERHGKLISDTRKGLDAGIAVIRDGATLYDIAEAIEVYAKEHGYGNVDQFHGHGIGENVHEDPAVHNSTRYAKNVILRAGMTLALEPMYTLGNPIINIDRNNPWQLQTIDKAIGAHFEDTVLVTKTGHEVLTTT